MMEVLSLKTMQMLIYFFAMLWLLITLLGAVVLFLSLVFWRTIRESDRRLMNLPEDSQ